MIESTPTAIYNSAAVTSDHFYASLSPGNWIGIWRMRVPET